MDPSMWKDATLSINFFSDRRINTRKGVTCKEEDNNKEKIAKDTIDSQGWLVPQKDNPQGILERRELQCCALIHG